MGFSVLYVDDVIFAIPGNHVDISRYPEIFSRSQEPQVLEHRFFNCTDIDCESSHSHKISAQKSPLHNPLQPVSGENYEADKDDEGIRLVIVTITSAYTVLEECSIHNF